MTRIYTFDDGSSTFEVIEPIIMELFFSTFNITVNKFIQNNVQFFFQKKKPLIIFVAQKTFSLFNFMQNLANLKS